MFASLRSQLPVCFVFFLLVRPPPTSPLFPYTTLFRSLHLRSRVVPASPASGLARRAQDASSADRVPKSEEHTSELQSPYDLVCRLLLEKKNKTKTTAL